MTVGELIERLRGYCERHPGRVHDMPVMVETANGGVPHRYMSPIVTATMGFDWTAGLCVVSTSDRLVVEKPITRPLSELAEERLSALQAAHEKLGFEYIKRREAAAWMAGFIEGAQQHFTGPADPQSDALARRPDQEPR